MIRSSANVVDQKCSWNE